MGKIEQMLFDLEEYLRRNDNSADSSAYLTIVGIANDVSELESENAKLQELCAALYRCADAGKPCETCPLYDGDGGCMDEQRMHELGIEVNNG